MKKSKGFTALIIGFIFLTMNLFNVFNEQAGWGEPSSPSEPPIYTLMQDPVPKTD